MKFTVLPWTTQKNSWKGSTEDSISVSGTTSCELEMFSHTKLRLTKALILQQMKVLFLTYQVTLLQNNQRTECQLGRNTTSDTILSNGACVQREVPVDGTHFPAEDMGLGSKDQVELATENTGLICKLLSSIPVIQKS